MAKRSDDVKPYICPHCDEEMSSPKLDYDLCARVLLFHNRGLLKSGAASFQRSLLVPAAIRFRRPHPKGRQAHGPAKER